MVLKHMGIILELEMISKEKTDQKPLNLLFIPPFLFSAKDQGAKLMIQAAERFVKDVQ